MLLYPLIDTVHPIPQLENDILLFFVLDCGYSVVRSCLVTAVICFIPSEFRRT